MQTKKQVISYFRYHHFTTLPSKESHSGFLSNLDFLEGLAGSRLEGSNERETWKMLLKAINSLLPDELSKMQCKIRSNKYR